MVLAILFSDVFSPGWSNTYSGKVNCRVFSDCCQCYISITGLRVSTRPSKLLPHGNVLAWLTVPAISALLNKLQPGGCCVCGLGHGSLVIGRSCNSIFYLKSRLIACKTTSSSSNHEIEQSYVIRITQSLTMKFRERKGVIFFKF